MVRPVRRVVLALGIVVISLAVVAQVASAAGAKTRPVSVTSFGTQGATASRNPAISANGRFIAFETGSHLVASDTSSVDDVFRRGPLR